MTNARLGLGGGYATGQPDRLAGNFGTWRGVMGSTGMKHLIACSAILLAACSGQQGAADTPDASTTDGAMATSYADGGAAASGRDMALTDEADVAMESNPDAGGAHSKAAASATTPIAPATTAAPKNIGTSIPSRYHGDWAPTRKDCAVTPNFYAIHISADRIGYFETSGDVQRVETDGRYAAVGLAERIGDGVERYTLYLALQPDGRLRTRRGADGEPKLYVACPSG